jgi:hypothetical protein
MLVITSEYGTGMIRATPGGIRAWLAALTRT